MCGIAGIVALNERGTDQLASLEHALKALHKRGPDHQGIYTSGHLALGHARLSILDISDAGSQPMTDPSGRFTIVFNGEFFNFKEHRDELLRRGIHLKSGSDTEVLLHWYILEGTKCLERINGFFAFAIYDDTEKTLFIARDRMGVKPLLLFSDNDRLCFASEMKALLRMDIPREIDPVSVGTYLQLNYIPGPSSIFKGVTKLEPGHCMTITNIGSSPSISKSCYYRLPGYDQTTNKLTDYTTAKNTLNDLLEAAVQRRMIADVPLGAFLSGGIDSSVVTALAARHTDKLSTFSIGFKDEPLFDETEYALAVAKKHHTDHTVFSLTNDDLLSILFDTLDYIDEPFGDSSALNVFFLSRETRKHVTVALSGDGADELFGGYNKHAAEWRIRHRGFLESMLIAGTPLLKALPQSRNTRWGNRFRQMNRFAQGSGLTAQERYWQWASFGTEQEAFELLPALEGNPEYHDRKSACLRFVNGGNDLNDILRNDVELVLTNDMLVKVDLMSMANSLEVRSPFMDYTVAEFAFSIPSAFKLDKTNRKKIIKDTFHDLLPDEVLQRNKQGFEVPLLKWFRNELRSLIENDLLSDHFIQEQGLFDLEGIRRLKRQLFHSASPGEAVHRTWGLIVFQYWWKKNMLNPDGN